MVNSGVDLFAVRDGAGSRQLAVYAAASIWKALDTTPDVSASEAGLLFHPAVRRTPAPFDEVSHWSLEMVSGHPVMWIHFHRLYWSLQGLFKRKAVKLEGRKEQLEPLFNFLARQSLMQTKFVDR